MSKIWDKFWNDEDFFIRVARGVGVALGGFVMSGGLSGLGWLPNEVGAGLMGLAVMFSGGASRTS